MEDFFFDDDDVDYEALAANDDDGMNDNDEEFNAADDGMQDNDNVYHYFTGHYDEHVTDVPDEVTHVTVDPSVADLSYTFTDFSRLTTVVLPEGLEQARAHRRIRFCKLHAVVAYQYTIVCQGD